MNKLEQAARQALVVLEGVLWTGDTQVLEYTAPPAITALREALAKQTEQEPVAYWDKKSGEVCRAGWLKFHSRECDKDRFTTPLYTRPVRTKDLTDDEIDAIDDANWENGHKTWDIKKFARAVIAADREKNRG